MTLEGVVVGVMESFPLQLSVTADGVVHHVALTEQTRVLRKGARVDPGEIGPSARLRITGRSRPGAERALAADAIEILSD